MRGAYERGEGSYQELAERFGVSKRTICRHGKDEAWEKTEPLLRPEQRAMREVTQKLHSAAMREVERLEEAGGGCENHPGSDRSGAGAEPAG
ncbi:MAG: hypothetical protein ACLUNQ_04500 [Oscillospiraceae bacterium]